MKYLEDKYGMKVIVNTAFNKNLIDITVVSKIQNLEREMFHKILNIADASIKTALIELGWTPPKNTTKEKQNEKD